MDNSEDNLYNDNKAKIILNHRQNTGKETPRKIRKNSLSKYNKEINNKKGKKYNKENINNNINIKINNKDNDNDNIKYNKLLKIKKGKEINNEIKIYSSYISDQNIFYLKNMVRKMIFNRFIHNIFLFIDKRKANTFKIYSISDQKKGDKNVEVILLNPLFIV